MTNAPRRPVRQPQPLVGRRVVRCGNRALRQLLQLRRIHLPQEARDQQRLDKYKDQIMAVKTNEQLHAMQHQMKSVEDDIGKQEERVLVNMMEADEINAAIKKAEAALKAAQAKVASERAAIENETKAHQATLAEMTSARGKIVSAMDNKGAIETFQRIAKVRGTAMARAEGERCTICQVRLRPAVFTEVRKNDSLVQCDSCNRILYFIAPQAPKAPEAPQAPAE